MEDNYFIISMAFAMHQHESATGTYVSPHPETLSHLPPRTFLKFINLWPHNTVHFLQDTKSSHFQFFLFFFFPLGCFFVLNVKESQDQFISQRSLQLENGDLIQRTGWKRIWSYWIHFKICILLNQSIALLKIHSIEKNSYRKVCQTVVCKSKNKMSFNRKNRSTK